jgi:hypothetical protein
VDYEKVIEQYRDQWWSVIDEYGDGAILIHANDPSKASWVSKENTSIMMLNIPPSEWGVMVLIVQFPNHYKTVHVARMGSKGLVNSYLKGTPLKL